MIVYPAIDLKDGQCVRLAQGRMTDATVFSDDPGAQARTFAASGARWLHVVDLNGAFAGRPVNAGAVEAILDAVDVPVQLGGGLRTLDAIEIWLDRGVRRVVLGTAAVKDPDLVRRACDRWPERVAVGIDARAGRVAIEGWSEQSDLPAAVLMARFEDAGVAAVIYTDIERDGMLQGVNVAATAALAHSTTVPVVASGGVGGIEDIKALKAAGAIAGAIVGRALYDGRIDLAAAIAAAE